MDFAERLDQLVTEAKAAGIDLDDMVADLFGCAAGLEHEINDASEDE